MTVVTTPRHGLSVGGPIQGTYGEALWRREGGMAAYDEHDDDGPFIDVFDPEEAEGLETLVRRLGMPSPDRADEEFVRALTAVREAYAYAYLATGALPIASNGTTTLPDDLDWFDAAAAFDESEQWALNGDWDACLLVLRRAAIDVAAARPQAAAMVSDLIGLDDPEVLELAAGWLESMWQRMDASLRERARGAARRLAAGTPEATDASAVDAAVATCFTTLADHGSLGWWTAVAVAAGVHSVAPLHPHEQFVRQLAGWDHLVAGPPSDAVLDELPMSVIRKVLAERGVSADDSGLLADLSAMAITLDAWRNSPLEDWHADRHGPSDGEMMRANVATTRVVRDHLRTFGLDLPGVARLLTDPDRLVVNDVTAAQFAGDSWHELTQHVRAHMAGLVRLLRYAGPERLVLLEAAHATEAVPFWWGTPWWQAAAESFVQALLDPADELWRIRGDLYERVRATRPPEAGDDNELLARLIDAPDRLDPETARWFVRWTQHTSVPWDARDRWTSQRRVDLDAPFALWQPTGQLS